MSTAETSYDDYVNSYLAGMHGGMCGCLDVAPLGESKWGIKDLKVFIKSIPTGLTRDQFTQVVLQGCKAWSDVCDLRFTLTNNQAEANVVIDAGRGSRVGMDGRGGVLAWAYLPRGNNFKGQSLMMFDLDEDFSRTDVLATFTHEMGHIIGLSHNNEPNQLMNPMLSRIRTPQAYSTRQAQSLYGLPKTQPTPGPNPTPTPSPSGAPKAVKVQGPDGRVWGSTQFVEVLPSQTIGENPFEW